MMEPNNGFICGSWFDDDEPLVRVPVSLVGPAEVLCRQIEHYILPTSSSHKSAVPFPLPVAPFEQIIIDPRDFLKMFYLPTLIGCPEIANRKKFLPLYLQGPDFRALQQSTTTGQNGYSPGEGDALTIQARNNEITIIPWIIFEQ